jgi:hypothetical protein
MLWLVKEQRALAVNEKPTSIHVRTCLQVAPRHTFPYLLIGTLYSL